MKNLYNDLLEIYGDVGKWWPGTPEEIIITSVLTQNTNWKNVEKALENIYSFSNNSKNLLFNLHKLPKNKLSELIKPAGFYNIKAERLKNLLDFLSRYKFKIESLKSIDTYHLRNQLLKIKGIGKETADSILLYALDKPIFVVDAYTKRIIKRIYNINEKEYDKVQEIFHNAYPESTELFQKLHGLIVEHAKALCRKKPLCDQCPINSKCNYNL
ncbi:MAG: endonuclease III domain-containing protein [Thermosipho sp. (in: Bacteria)]|nr:endonuclease III domain-containing protein [Thermosipho sp. (in: thermotogales)]